MNRNIQPYKRFQIWSLAAGVVGWLGMAAGYFLTGPVPFMQAYLFAYMFWLELALGSLAIVMLFYLVGGGWGVIIRQSLEAAARTLWLLAILFIPIALGLHFLYPWTEAGWQPAGVISQFKSSYLNVPFFLGRSMLYFLIWLGLAYVITRWGTQRRYHMDPDLRRRLQRISAAGLGLFALSMTFAAIDWLMSLQPDWYSTIYGLLIINGQVLGSLALAIALLPIRSRSSGLAYFVTPLRIRDLGALLLTAVMFWAYLAYSQFLVIWTGNLPHEVTWYQARSSGGWQWLSLMVVILQFFIPFIVLLSLRAKRNPKVLMALAIAILLTRLVDNFWQVKPAFFPAGLTIHWLDFLAPVAIGGFWLALFFWNLPRVPEIMSILAPGEAHEVEQADKYTAAGG